MVNNFKNNSVVEQEYKYVLTNSLAQSAIQWLKAYCYPDSKFPSGVISSIYYDTYDWQSLQEKSNGDFFKSKFRIRWYADIDGNNPGDKSYLEVKYKIGIKREKNRIETSLSGKWLSRASLNDHKLLRILQMLRSEGVRMSKQFYPIFQITYKRLRFIDLATGVRLCIDYDINVPKVNWQMVPRCNSFYLKNAVVEVKGHLTKLPVVLQKVINLGFQKSSFSKYMACYKKIMQFDS